MNKNPKRRFISVCDKYIGSRIKLLRLSLLVSRIQLARDLNMSHQQITKYESGFNRISASLLFKIAWLFNVNCSYFIEGYDFDEVDNVVPKVVNRKNQVALMELVANLDKMQNKAVIRSFIEVTKVALERKK